MQHQTQSLAFFLAIAGLALSACSQQSDDSTMPQSDATPVRAAEAPAGNAGDLMASGKTVYLANCAACHQAAGTGLAGAFPPLAGSDYLQGNRKKIMAGALFGLSGPITVNGVNYNGVMPSMGHLSDQDLAAALTYVFGSWGNDVAPVSVEEVTALRAELGH